MCCMSSKTPPGFVEGWEDRPAEHTVLPAGFLRAAPRMFRALSLFVTLATPGSERVRECMRGGDILPCAGPVEQTGLVGMAD